MIANGHVVGDGSWDLRVFVTDLQAERQIRVKGDVHIGGVMLRLVEDLGELILYPPAIIDSKSVFSIYSQL